MMTPIARIVVTRIDEDGEDFRFEVDCNEDHGFFEIVTREELLIQASDVLRVDVNSLLEAINLLFSTKIEAIETNSDDR